MPYHVLPDNGPHPAGGTGTSRGSGVNILLLAPHPFFQVRGTPLAVRTILEFLCSRGHHVDVLTFHEGEDVNLPNCRIHRIARIPGIRNIRPGFSLKKVLCDWLMLLKCIRLIKRKRYDLIHAVEESAFIAAGVEAVTRIPYVYDMDSSLVEQMVDTFPKLRWVSAALRQCEGFVIRRSLGVLTVCTALATIVHGHAPRKLVARVEDTTLLPYIDHPSNSGAGVPPEIAELGPVAMYVGNLERYQGIDLLLHAFRYVLEAVPNAQLVIVGGRPEDISRYQVLARAGGDGDHVHFLGPRPISHLPALFKHADVLVSPRLKGVNTPMKIYSYLDSGAAVLATRLPTHTQVLDQRIAYLVEPEPEALGRGLAELLKDPDLRAQLAMEAKRHVQEEYTREAAHRKLGKFYSLVESRAAEIRS
jgi:glycosyltransferase involved in cell wall biosynthesis